ncbi:hypothetical protein Tco_0048599, partial [Tanacetum coccineum]
SLKNWNNHFFWIDAFVCHVSILSFEGHSIQKDPLLSRDVVDLNLVEWLNEGRVALRKYLMVFLYVIGLSRSFVDDNVRPTLKDLTMGLLDFVKSSNSFKVKIGERTLAKDEVSLSKENEDMVISPSNETLRLVEHTITDKLKSVASKKKRKLEALVATKVEELAGLGTQNVELLAQVEGEAKLREEFMAMQDDEVQRLEERNADLDACLSELNYQVNSELYPHMLTVVAGRSYSLAIDQDIQQGLEAG